MYIQPLLNRRPLLPDESLPSLFSRLARANYYKNPAEVVAICLNHLPQNDNLFLPTHAETWSVLTAVTRLPVLALYEATFHRYAATLALPGKEPQRVTFPDGQERPLLPQRLQREHLLPLHDAQFCPQCLRENGYHRLVWLNVVAAACIRHECLLQKGCPDCGQKLSVQAIVEGKCEQCRFDLVASPVQCLGDDSWGLFSQQLLQSWWSDVAPPAPPDQTTILQQPPAPLLELLRGLAKATSRWSESALHPAPISDLVRRKRGTIRLLPLQVYRSYATAMKGLVDWPVGFHRFLNVHRTQVKAPAGQVTKELAPLYLMWVEGRWRRDEFAFVQEAFDDFLIATYPLTRSVTHLDRYRRSQFLRNRFPCLTEGEAAEWLGVEPEIVRRLVEVGLLVPDEARRLPGHMSVRVVRRIEFDELRKRWEAGIPIVDLAQILGVGEGIVGDLVSAGILAHHHQESLAGDNPPLIGKDAVNTFVRKLAPYPALPHSLGETASLGQLAKSDEEVVRLVRKVVDGQLVGLGLWGSLYDLQVAGRERT
jgi:hypothetical protein